MDSNAIVALLLVLGSLSYLFPALAALLSLIKIRRYKAEGANALSIDILVPCYNEADTIEETLKSLEQARRAFIAIYPEAKVTISVGLDGPNDKTRDIVNRMAQSFSIRVLDRGFNRGKWVTLTELAASATGTWSALVDAGSLWPETLLADMAADLKSDAYVGLAPGYSQGKRAGLLERLVWWQERSVKFLENLAGGPFSLHGATMFFRTTELQSAFRVLGYHSWKNDDVVLGLTLRERGPIRYYGEQICVSDCGIRTGASELNRRRRMLQGNIEWIREIFPKIVVSSPVVALLALRRIVRLFWAYCILAAAVLFCQALQLPLFFTLLCVGLVVGVFFSNRRLREAALVSLLSPWWILKGGDSVSWI